jgi:hypothetical protein
MTGRGFLTVPGFLRGPKGVQERTGGTSIAVRPSQRENWSQDRTIVPDSYLPDQERSGQERENAKVSAGLPFPVPDVPGKLVGTIFIRYFNALEPVPGFLPSLKRGRRFRNRPSLMRWRGKEWAPADKPRPPLARQL